MSTLMEVRRLEKRFPLHRGLLQRKHGEVRAVDGVDLDLCAGECSALVGESGSGKTTLGRCLIRLIEPDGGELRFAGKDLRQLPAGELRRWRRRFQMVFQDPYGSLNPRMRVRRLLAEPLRVHGIVARHQLQRRTEELLEMVGLTAEAAERFPHQFSGGQRQRIGIARALATEPDLLIADEPVTALDVSVQAQIINLLTQLQARLGLTLLLIAHDLAVVEHIADRVSVMYLGRIVEQADRATLFSRPRHPYTVSLLSAVPVAEVPRRRQRIVLPGELASPLRPPSGCPFHPRCPVAQSRCLEEVPTLVGEGEGSRVACFYPGTLEVPAQPGPGAGGWNFQGSAS